MTPLAAFWGLGTGRSLLLRRSQQIGGELIMGLLRDSEDSVSACSKKTYLTARSRARPRVITCSRSMLVGPRKREREEGGHR